MFVKENSGYRKPEKFFLIMIVILLAVCLAGLLAMAVFGSLKRGDENNGADIPAFDDGGDANDESADDNEEEQTSYVFNVTDATKIFADDELNAEYAMLCDPETLTILAHTGGDERIYPASMTKIMTMIVAIEEIGDLDATFTFEQHIINYFESQGASRAKFKAGETVKVRDLLYGAALPSGGDATAGLAILACGSESLFAEKMNEKAAQLGLKNTHFVNASGLHHDNHYTTLSDMATIFAYALKNETLLEIMSTKTYTTGATNMNPDGLNMSSHLFSRLAYVNMPENLNVICGKTGYTDEAKHCLITLSEDKATGKKYIFVTAKCTYTTTSLDGNDGRYQPLYDLGIVYSKYIRQ